MTIINNHSTAVTTEGYFPLAAVPKDPLLTIFSETNLEDLIKLPQVSQYFHGIMKEDGLWVKIAQKIGYAIQEITDSKISHIHLIRRKFIEVKEALEHLIKDDSKGYMPSVVRKILAKEPKFDAEQNLFIEMIPTYDEIKLLKDYSKARDTLRVWEILTSKETPGFLYGYQMKSARQIIDLANGFSNWFAQNKNYLLTLTARNLSCQKFFTLPDEIGQLTQLKELFLQANKFVTLPPKIKELVQLKVLNLSCNSFSTISSEIGQLTQLRELNLLANQLSSLPVEIGQLTQLQGLDLGNNKLSILPSAIGQLHQLRRLNLSWNNLSVLPSEIWHLHQLQELNLLFNRLSTLPSDIGQINQLQVLNLSATNLSILPSEIGQLRQLRKLNLSQNKLSILPSEIGQLRQLEELDLSKNKLSILPSEIRQLRQLRELNLSQNRLSILPPEIYRIPSLSTDGNPISFMNNVNYFIYTHRKNLFRIATATTLTALAYFYRTQIATGLPYIGAIAGAIAIQKLVHRYF